MKETTQQLFARPEDAIKAAEYIPKLYREELHESFRIPQPAGIQFPCVCNGLTKLAIMT